ncbi:hypothetical protein HETIRDRAFT_383456, partial [Heterobasidion irregulare TC 32-1]
MQGLSDTGHHQELMMANPNFPENLSISPSQHPQTILTAPVTAADPYVSHFAFDASAQAAAIEKYGIAGRVWEAAYLLTLYFNAPPSHAFDPPFDPHGASQLTVVELGSGTGIVGLKLAERLARTGTDSSNLVVLTDLPEVCPLLQENLQQHAALTERDVWVRALPWGSRAHADTLAEELGLRADPPSEARPRYPTHIVCSDLVYFPELLAPLLRTLLHLTSPPFVPVSASSLPSPPEVIVSYKIRSLAKETAFWSAFGLWFTFTPVLTSPSASTSPDLSWKRFGASVDAFILIAHRRPESMRWPVPEDDAGLLGGVGAHGMS